MTNKEFVAKAIDIAKNYKTCYVWGAFGWPMTAQNKKRIIAEYTHNQTAANQAIINACTADTFGFDCVNLIKAILWGWSGDKSKSYGGAKYNTSVCPDVGANTMITLCKDVKAGDWQNIVPGEVVWLSGHIGIYVGDGVVVEATPRWSGNVQKTALGNIGGVPGMNSRTWTRHGKLPWVTYETEKETKPLSGDFAVGEIVDFVGNTHYGNEYAASGYRAKPGPAKVTIVRGGNPPHPIHVIHTDNTSNVYGWVNKNDIKKRSK